MKKWRMVIVVGVIFMSILSGMVWAGDKFVKGIIHAHDTNSDGLFPQTMYRPWFKTTGCKYFYQTDHLDCLIGKCEHKSHQKRSSNYVLEYLKQQTGPYFRGIECFTELNGQHILLLGTDWANIRSLYKANTGQILSYAKNNYLVSILAHPHDGYKLEYLNNFTALEFFNTKGYEITKLSKRIKNEKYERAESIDLDIYCMAIKYYCNDYFPGTGSKTKNVPGIVGGCDLHASELELSFGQTFIAVSDTKAISLLTINDAVMSGKTCAVFSNIPGLRAWINSINYSPNRKKIYEVPQIVLKGKITAENCNKLDIYLDGYFNKSLKINKGVIEFNETITTKKGRHVVFLYAKHRLITSPIIFDVIGEVTPAVASTSTPTASPAPAVVKPKKFTESLKFHPYPTSGTGGGYYDYTVKDEMGKVVFKHQLDRHDCVVLAGNCVIVVAKAFDNGAWNIDDKTVPYYGQYFGYDRKKGVFVPFFTIAGTTRQYKANYSEAEHAIINRRRNEVICLDLLETFNELSKQELQFVKDIPDQIDKQLAVFLKTMPEEFFERYFNTNDYSDIKSIKRRIYKQYASVEMSSSCGFRLYVLLKREGERWRITYANSVNIISQSYSMSRDVIEKLHWQKAKIVNQYPEYHFYH